MRASVFLGLIVAATAAIAGCEVRQENAVRQEGRIMKITSPAFEHDATIPSVYTCDGRDSIPPLAFEGVPDGAASLALIVDDPDAPMGTWDHWVVWNIPPTTRGVDEGKIPAGVVGRNSWKRNDWGGPCPPSGEHRYFFKLFALDSMLDLPPNATKEQLERAMRGHVLAQSEMIGRYRRPGR